MKIFHQDSSGFVHITIPAEGMDAEGVKTQMAQLHPDWAWIGDDLSMPPSREFRNAWRHNTGAIEESLPEATEIHKDRLRRERKPLLEELDAKIMKALEIGGTFGDIKTEKQRLRDLPQRADAATTLDELRAVRTQG